MITFILKYTMYMYLILLGIFWWIMRGCGFCGGEVKLYRAVITHLSDAWCPLKFSIFFLLSCLLVVKSQDLHKEFDFNQLKRKVWPESHFALDVRHSLRAITIILTSSDKVNQPTICCLFSSHSSILSVEKEILMFAFAFLTGLWTVLCQVSNWNFAKLGKNSQVFRASLKP